MTPILPPPPPPSLLLLLPRYQITEHVTAQSLAFILLSPCTITAIWTCHYFVRFFRLWKLQTINNNSLKKLCSFLQSTKHHLVTDMFTDKLINYTQLMNNYFRLKIYLNSSNWDKSAINISP